MDGVTRLITGLIIGTVVGVPAGLLIYALIRRRYVTVSPSEYGLTRT
jgi:hypothetical protein